MKDNKGFSLVELIIVIAIMAVLVGVLAPQFIKYVEQSRRSRDIQNADQIREAFLADIAEGETSGTGSMIVEIDAAHLPGTINDTPLITGNVVTPGGTFSVTFNANANTIMVYPTSDPGVAAGGNPTYDLTSQDGIAAYKAA
jgi:type IV pilus assembly protein PilA